VFVTSGVTEYVYKLVKLVITVGCIDNVAISIRGLSGVTCH